MGMVVRTNAMAINANRQLGVNNSNLSKSLEKLSSGYRINRAGDDASGLAISEKMKAQIKGLDQAASNAQDGISLVQTAEGATTEIHNMLNRMTELATKSANGTIQDKVDREAIQSEVDALTTEITRITQSTNFNGINLLDGSLGGAQQIASVDGAYSAGTTTYTATIDGTNKTLGTITGSDTGIKTATAGTGFTPANLVAALQAEATSKQETATAFSASVNGSSVEIKYGTTVVATATLPGTVNTAAGGTNELDFGGNLGKVTLKNGTGSITGVDGDALAAAVNSLVGSVKATVASATAGGSAVKASSTVDFDGRTGADLIGGKMEVKLSDTASAKFQFVATGKTADTGYTAIEVADTDTAATLAQKYTTALNANTTINATFKATQGTGAGKTQVTLEQTNAPTQASEVYSAPKTTTSGMGLTLQIGDSAKPFNKVTVSIADLSAAGLNLLGANGKLDVSTQTAAGTAIDTIKTAINTVSSNRANLGALQNRMEYTINNLNTTSENMSTANSRIRDTDMASEMTKYTQSNILTQAAQAMLAQANQAPQQILQLLQ